MEILFHGTGSAYNALMDNNNAYFFHDRHLVLIDCGETAFHAICARRLLEDCAGEIVVLLTHTHADHAGSLSTVLSYCYYRLGRHAHLVHPSDAVVRLLELMGTPQTQYRYHAELGDMLAGLSVQAVRVRHLEDIQCFGYLLKDAQSTVYYSGDAAEIPPKILEALTNGSLDLVFQDVNWQQTVPEVVHHLPFQTLCKVVPQKLRSRVVCMHMNCDYREIVEDAGFSCVCTDGHGQR